MKHSRLILIQKKKSYIYLRLMLIFLFFFFKGPNLSPRQNTLNRRPQQRSGSGGQQTSTSRSGEPLKFDSEFDFEQANARFEEIEKEFNDKLKISSGKPQQQRETQHNNDTSLTNSQSVSMQDMQDQHLIMKKNLNTETAEKQKDLDHNRSSLDEEQKNFYDKNISFFDRISCESNEKSQSKPKNWKEERKINAETFGLQQRQQGDSKPMYNRQYNNQNRTNGNYQHQQQQQQSNNGRNYPRNNNYLNNSGNQPQSSRLNKNQNNSQRYNSQRASGNSNMRSSAGYSNPNNYRRNEMEVNSRRFGSR